MTELLEWMRARAQNHQDFEPSRRCCETIATAPALAKQALMA
jgi:hypothetical protein